VWELIRFLEEIAGIEPPNTAGASEAPEAQPSGTTTTSEAAETERASNMADSDMELTDASNYGDDSDDENERFDENDSNYKNESAHEENNTVYTETIHIDSGLQDIEHNDTDHTDGKLKASSHVKMEDDDQGSRQASLGDDYSRRMSLHKQHAMFTYTESTNDTQTGTQPIEIEPSGEQQSDTESSHAEHSDQELPELFNLRDGPFMRDIYFRRMPTRWQSKAGVPHEYRIDNAELARMWADAVHDPGLLYTECEWIPHGLYELVPLYARIVGENITLAMVWTVRSLYVNSEWYERRSKQNLRHLLELLYTYGVQQRQFMERFYSDMNQESDDGLDYGDDHDMQEEFDRENNDDLYSAP
jgi:hypothetical protein